MSVRVFFCPWGYFCPIWDYFSLTNTNIVISSKFQEVFGIIIYQNELCKRKQIKQQKI
jgi:hypothetical protein